MNCPFLVDSYQLSTMVIGPVAMFAGDLLINTCKFYQPSWQTSGPEYLGKGWRRARWTDFQAPAGHLICHPRRANDNRKITQLCLCPPGPSLPLPHSFPLFPLPSLSPAHSVCVCGWVGVQSWFVWPLDWFAPPTLEPSGWPACISASGFCIWHQGQSWSRSRGGDP